MELSITEGQGELPGDDQTLETRPRHPLGGLKRIGQNRPIPRKEQCQVRIPFSRSKSRSSGRSPKHTQTHLDPGFSEGLDCLSLLRGAPTFSATHMRDAAQRSFGRTKEGQQPNWPGDLGMETMWLTSGLASHWSGSSRAQAEHRQ